MAGAVSHSIFSASLLNAMQVEKLRAYLLVKSKFSPTVRTNFLTKQHLVPDKGPFKREINILLPSKFALLLSLNK